MLSMDPRELGGVERMTLTLDRISTVNFTTIARVRGKFDDAQLRHALGREVTGHIQSQKADGIPFLTSPFSGGLIRWLRALLGSKMTLRLCESQLTRRSLAVTNLGLLERLDVQERYGALEIEELHFFAAVSVMGPLGATATTFRNRLQLNLGHVEPRLSRATMERFQYHLRRTLDAFDSSSTQ
jgi:hypothetical protein